MAPDHFGTIKNSAQNQYRSNFAIQSTPHQHSIDLVSMQRQISKTSHLRQSAASASSSACIWNSAPARLERLQQSTLPNTKSCTQALRKAASDQRGQRSQHSAAIFNEFAEQFRPPSLGLARLRCAAILTPRGALPRRLRTWARHEARKSDRKPKRPKRKIHTMSIHRRKRR